jgi:hypothetical protein
VCRRGDDEATSDDEAPVADDEPPLDLGEDGAAAGAGSAADSELELLRKGVAELVLDPADFKGKYYHEKFGILPSDAPFITTVRNVSVVSCCCA